MNRVCSPRTSVASVTACVILGLSAASFPPPVSAQTDVGVQEYAELGECELAGGGVILDCRVGYRTFGTLNPARSNAVLVPSWFGGTSKELAGFIRPGGLVDPERWFVVVVDAFGNGVSSSPSTSRDQGGQAFPQFTIGDMVAAQRRLLRDELGIDSLAGLVGISMGGMQVFEWIVRYPDAAQAAVAIAATPRAGPYARVAWDAYLRLIRLMETEAKREAEAIFAALEYLRGTSPAFVARQVPPDGIDAVLDSLAAQEHSVPRRNDLASQARAIAAFDVTSPYGGDLERAAERVRSRLAIVATRSDHYVTPFASIEFARLTDAELLLLENDCGHIGASCEPGPVLEAIRRTLDGPPDTTVRPAG